MQKPKKAPQKTVTPSASKPSAGHKVVKSASPNIKPAAVAAAKKVPTVKKKTQPIVVTKKNVPAKAPAKVQVKVAVSKKSLGKAPVHKPVKLTAHKPSAAIAKVEVKKKTAAPTPVPASGKAQTVSQKAPTKPSVKTPAAEAERIAAKPEKKFAPAEPELKAKKAREEVETIVETVQPEEEVILTDAEGRRYCRVKDCDQAATIDGGYCRFHYLLFWKNIQSRRKILSEGKLERYIEELTARYPDKYLELLRKDLRSEKDFMAAIQELEIDDSGVDNEFEDEAQSYLDEVRGMSNENNGEREEEF